MNTLIHWLERLLGPGLGPTLFALLSLLVVAVLVRRFAPERRRYLRIGVSFFLMYLVSMGAAALLLWFGGTTWGGRLRLIANFFLEALIISQTGLVAFFLVLPRVRISFPDIVRDLIIGVAYFIALISLLRGFGVEVWSLLATSAVASIVIGVSLQPTLASIFGGIALQLDGSVRAGDWVRLTDRQEGKVREIRWRHTLIETRDGDILILPNSQLLQQQILVLGRRDTSRLQRRVWVNFHVDARVDPEQVIEVVSSALHNASLENVASDPKPECICLSMASSAVTGAVEYAVRYWLLDLAREDPTSSLVTVRIHAALRRAGIPLAQPQRRVITFKESIKAQLSEHRAELRRRMDILASIHLFDDLQDSELESLAEKLKPAPFCKGEEISRQGAEAHWLYILVSGTAEAKVKLPSGSEKHLGEIRAPDIFGEFGLLTGAPRRETVVATSRVECLRLDKAELRGLLLKRPEIAEELSRRLAERQEQFEKILGEGGIPSQRPTANPQRHLFSTIKSFFGLDDDGPASLRRG
ncbi:MAG: mechanosensitive ion channel family protein [Myxococcales bacterium]|nr:mechanosensitive ion channel family protein [Polyangiaceae bacterium]MDW8250627.1 mechanosensitive ion channel family protein [Myxococcales bacterium]